MDVHGNGVTRYAVRNERGDTAACRGSTSVPLHGADIFDLSCAQQHLELRRQKCGGVCAGLVAMQSNYQFSMFEIEWTENESKR